MIWTIVKLKVLNNVTNFHKILIQSIRLRERTSFHMVNFHKPRSITPEGTIIKLEKDIMVLNNVTKFHKILIKTIRLKELTSLGVTCRRGVRTDVPTRVTLKVPAIVMARA